MARPSARAAHPIATALLRALLGFAFLAIGVAKLTGKAYTIELFAAIGWGQWFRYFTGTLDVAGALLVLSPWLPFYGALLLACTVGTAVALSVVKLHNNPGAGVALLSLALAVAWLMRPRRLASSTSI
jgi:putative oxidoreductase